MKAVLNIEIDLSIHSVKELERLLKYLFAQPTATVSVSPKSEPEPEPEPEVKPKRKRRTSAKKRVKKGKPEGRKVVEDPIDVEVPDEMYTEEEERELLQPAPSDADADTILKAEQAKHPDKVVELHNDVVTQTDEDNPNVIFSSLVQRSQEAAIGLLKKHGQKRFSDAQGDVLRAMLSDAKVLLAKLS